MPDKKTIFVYGSLRKGMYNYKAFDGGLKYIETKKIKGYRMHSLGAFPFVVKDPNSSIIIDVMEATNTTKKSIDAMEFGAGYYEEKITVDEYEGHIYIYSRNRNVEVVEDGDWVKFLKGE